MASIVKKTNMEIHFKCGNDVFRLPVIPSAFNIEGTNIVNVENVNGTGEVTVYGGRGLKSIELSSFFPSKNYPFNAYSNVPKPYDCVAKIRKWFDGGYAIRLIITDTDINMVGIITSFQYGQNDFTGDVTYNIQFQEYRKVEVVEYKPLTGATGTTSSGNNSRPSTENTNQTKKVHKVKKGDNMWDISQKYYGKGSIYKKINEANWGKYPSLKKNNIIYVGWELVIP